MNWIGDFLSLIYPRLCICCHNDLLREERHLCFSCHGKLPYTFYAGMTENPVSSIFSGRIEIQAATALLHFERGNAVQKIMHELKYRGNPDIGAYFGQIMGEELMKSGNYSGVQAILPVPLHEAKRRMRGYNQSEAIAGGINKVLNSELVTNALFRKNRTASQTRKKRYERWENVSSVFEVSHERLKKFSHLLIVDDVITTGATIEACASIICAAAPFRLSVATLARSA